MQHLSKKKCHFSGHEAFGIFFNGIYKLKESKTHIARLLENICLKDDQKSFEEVFKLFYERLLNFCIRYIKDRESSEEIVSDVLFRIWLKRSELSHVQNLETYLFIAVKNQS
jgi:RNA polymerase sigma-70 factor (ECF subfamily)